MNNHHAIKLTLKTGLSKSLYKDCIDLNAFKRRLCVAMMAAMQRRFLPTEKTYLRSFSGHTHLCLN